MNGLLFLGSSEGPGNLPDQFVTVDGTHKLIGFQATGEPETRRSEALEMRGGELHIDPEPNGPLQVSGNLEICSGTGRTIDRLTSTVDRLHESLQ